MGKNVLVTGAAGFIGSHLVDYLISKNYNVISLDDLSGGFVENINKKSIFVQGSINNKELINKIFDQYKFTYVFHFAAYAAEGLSHFIRGYNYTNNLLGSINLINASINIGTVKCFVFASSIAVYGKNQLPMTEEAIPIPEDPYGISKYAVEMDLRNAKEIFGLDSIIFRPHNVYGERQNIGDPYRNVVGIFINQIMQNKPLTIFGDGKQTRAFSYIHDIVPIIGESIEKANAYNQVFNIGADEPYSVSKLAKLVSSYMGVKEDIKFLDARNEVVHAFSDHSKVNKVFGNTKGISLENGLLNMINWAKLHGTRKGMVFNEIEIEKNMPESWKNLTK